MTDTDNNTCNNNNLRLRHQSFLNLTSIATTTAAATTAAAATTTEVEEAAGDGDDESSEEGEGLPSNAPKF